MRNLLIALAIVGTATGPAIAQAAPVTNEASEAKAKTEKKVVCKRVEVEIGTGSRLGTQSKICREVVVPAPSKEEAHENHNGHTSGR